MKPLRICLVRPGLREREALNAEGPAWRLGRRLVNAVSPVKIGDGSELPSLALMVLAALTPPEHEVVIVDEDVEDIDFDLDADLVGITLLTMTAARGYEIADRFRERGVKVVLGGMHATVLPAEAARHADAVVIGEAEGVWHRVLADAQAGVLSGFYRSETHCDLAGMPMPRRELLSRDRYLITQIIETTRGCPNRCSFCSIHAVTGSRYRCRPIAEVIAEIESFDNPFALFVDDNVVGNPAYAKRLFEALAPLGIWWLGQATVSVAADDELLELAAKSGCKGLLIGFESVYQDNIRAIGKTKTNEVAGYAEAVKKIHAHGICITGSFILGLEHDDTTIFERTVDFIGETAIDVPVVGVLTPYPGTRLYHQLEREGRILHRDWSRYARLVGEVVFEPRLMTPEQLVRGHDYVCRRIYDLGSTARRLLAVRKNIVPVTAFTLRKRKSLWGTPARVRLEAALEPVTDLQPADTGAETT